MERRKSLLIRMTISFVLLGVVPLAAAGRRGCRSFAARHHKQQNSRKKDAG